MGMHRLVELGRLLHRGGDFGEAEIVGLRRAEGRARDAARRDLDPIDAALDLATDRQPHRIRAARDHAQTGRVMLLEPGGRVVEQAGDAADDRTGGHDVRPGAQSAPHAVAHRRPQKTAAAAVADRGDAGREDTSGVARREQGVELDRFLALEHPHIGSLGVIGQMRVGVDQPGQHRAAFDIDDLGIPRRPTADTDDGAVLDDDGLIARRFGAGSIDQQRALQNQLGHSDASGFAWGVGEARHAETPAIILA